MNKHYYFYILESKNGTRYYGHTNNLKRRFVEHSRGRVLSTKARKPLKLIYYKEVVSCSEAVKIEQKFKNGRTRKKTIEKIIKAFPKAKCQGFNSQTALRAYDLRSLRSVSHLFIKGGYNGKKRIFPKKLFWVHV